MKEPATLLIRELDEERTLVDPRFPVGDQRDAPNRSDDATKREKMPRWRAASSMLSHRRRRFIELGVGLLVFFGLGSVAYQQHKMAEMLRETLVGMRIPAQDSAAPHSGRAQRESQRPAGESGLRMAQIEELSPDEREALERRAAAFVASNDFAGALPHYQRLVELFPHVEPFRHVVSVLRAKLGCDRFDRPTSGMCT